MCGSADVVDAVFLVRFDMEAGLVLGMFWGMFWGRSWACSWAQPWALRGIGMGNYRSDDMCARGARGGLHFERATSE